MRKIKVLNLVSWFPNESNPLEGIFIKEHIKAINKFVDVRIIYGSEKKKFSKVTYRRKVVDGMNVVYFNFGKLPVPGGSFFPYLKGFYGAFKEFKKEGFVPNVIHAHVYKAGVPAVILGAFTGIPVIITEHYSIFVSNDIRGKENIKAQFAFQNAQCVTAVSKFLATHIKKYAGEKQVKVVPNVVDHSLFHPPDFISNNVPLKFITVAHLEKHKGIDYLIKAAEILKKKGYNFKVIIVGDGNKKYEYKREILEKGLTEVVHLVGGKTHQEVAELMRRSDSFVLPSLGETFGVVLIEAMATGLPIITTDCGGPSEIVDSESGIVIPPANEKALAQAMEKFIKGAVSFDRGKIYQKSLKFSYDSVGEKFLELYNELIKGGNSEQ